VLSAPDDREEAGELYDWKAGSGKPPSVGRSKKA
jgi:hypothetical protein